MGQQQVVEGWAIVVNGTRWVTATASGGQEIDIGQDGTMTFAVMKCEEGYGYHTGSPQEREAPVAVIVAMIAMWKAT